MKTSGGRFLDSSSPESLACVEPLPTDLQPTEAGDISSSDASRLPLHMILEPGAIRSCGKTNRFRILEKKLPGRDCIGVQKAAFVCMGGNVRHMSRFTATSSLKVLVPKVLHARFHNNEQSIKMLVKVACPDFSEALPVMRGNANCNEPWPGGRGAGDGGPQLFLQRHVSKRPRRANQGADALEAGIDPEEEQLLFPLAAQVCQPARLTVVFDSFLETIVTLHGALQRCVNQAHSSMPMDLEDAAFGLHCHAFVSDHLP